MEITKLYIVELKNGERHIFASEYDRNTFLNLLDAKHSYLRYTAKTYEWEIG